MTKKILGIGISGVVFILLIMAVWDVYSRQMPLFFFQNSTYKNLPVLKAVDQNGRFIAMQRAYPLLSGQYRSIGGGAGVPRNIQVTWKLETEDQERTAEISIDDMLPWRTWFWVRFTPWLYDLGIVINILPSHELYGTWFLVDRRQAQKSFVCGGWLVDKFRSRLERNFDARHLSHLSDQERDFKRKSFMCMALGYVNREHESIQEDLRKINGVKVLD